MEPAFESMPEHMFQSRKWLVACCMLQPCFDLKFKLMLELFTRLHDGTIANHVNSALTSPNITVPNGLGPKAAQTFAAVTGTSTYGTSDPVVSAPIAKTPHKATCLPSTLQEITAMIRSCLILMLHHLYVISSLKYPSRVMSRAKQITSPWSFAPSIQLPSVCVVGIRVPKQ